MAPKASGKNKGLLEGYDPSKISIGCLGSHSALDICEGGSEEGFETTVVCQSGRELPYLRFKRIFDNLIVLDKFKDVAQQENIHLLRKSSCIWIPNRSFSTYLDYKTIEENFNLPMFGNRFMLKTEERSQAKNQYELFKKAGIKYPKQFKDPSSIDRLVIVKVEEAKRKIERAFFTAASPKEFEIKAKERIERGIIAKEALNRAVIEEYVVGALFNFNYFYSPLKNEVEFMGIDRRIQTNLDGILHIPAEQQLEANLCMQNIEVGHRLATIRESMLQKVFEIGDAFVKASKQLYSPGIIGPFALQSAVTSDLEIIVFDLSPRVPGSPVLALSPYMKAYHGEWFSSGRRIAREIKLAAEEEKLSKVIT